MPCFWILHVNWNLLWWAYSWPDAQIFYFYDTKGINQVNIRDALRDLVPFVQFKKYEKPPCRSATFSKVAGWSFTKSNAPPWVFLNYANGTKSRKVSHIYSFRQTTQPRQKRIIFLNFFEPHEALKGPANLFGCFSISHSSSQS